MRQGLLSRWKWWAFGRSTPHPIRVPICRECQEIMDELRELREQEFREARAALE